MNRRRFIGAAAAAGLVKSAHADVEVKAPRPRNSYETLFRDIEPGHDEFPLEKEAFEISSHLKRFFALRGLPMAPGLRGISPCPARYQSIADGVSSAEYDTVPSDIAAGLVKWLDSLGKVRAIRFYVLPDNLIRFEVSSDNRHRVGFWKQKWEDGRLMCQGCKSALFTGGEEL